MTTIDEIVSSMLPSTSRVDSVKKLLEIYQYVDINQIIADPINLFKVHVPISRNPQLIDVGIRFTVQMNLFVGSILNFGTDQHRKLLEDKSIIGCFALTERNAGVSSGLFIKTRCDYNSVTKQYVLNTGDYNNRKVWISQGMYAKYCVVFAELYTDDVNQGVRPFLIQMRDDDNNLIVGITVEDLGQKYVVNNLDNVSICFKNVTFGEHCLMNRRECRSFFDIIDRLLTGRIILAECAFESSKKTIDDLYKSYVMKKEIYINKELKTVKLVELPHIKKIFDEYAKNYRIGHLLIKESKEGLCRSMQNNQRPSKQLIELINCTKIFCTESVYNTMIDIQRNLGSEHLLNHGCNPSIYVPFLIAEGDTLILRQKLASDNIQHITKNISSTILSVIKGDMTLTELLQVVNLMYSVSGSKDCKEIQWINNLDKVKSLSETVLQRIIKSKL